MDTFLTVSAHCFTNSLPTGVEPVKVSLRTMGLAVISPPMARELVPHTTLISPGGMPARSASATRASADRGVSLAGLITMPQPTARAGPALRVIMAAGKFQGVMAAHTPMGCLITTARRSVWGVGITSP